MRHRLVIASLALAALAPAAPASETPAAAAPAAAVASADEVFAEGVVRRYALELPEARWRQAEANAVRETWTAARLRVDGAPVGVVGVRFKGSLGTLAGCFREGVRVCPKLSLKLGFDRFVAKQRFAGLERLNFHAMAHDASLMRERLAYGVFEAAGVPAPRTAWARVSVNGDDLGLFAVVEEIDGRFAERHFPQDDGLLYKEAWPVSQEDAYYEPHLRTNRSKPHRHDRVTEFARELAEAPDDATRAGVLERWTDVDALLRYMAADRLVGNWDGVTAFFCDGASCENHNFYWYAEARRPRLSLLPWDLDDAFRLYDPLFATLDWRSPPGDCEARPLAWGKVPTRHPGCDPLLRALAATGPERFRAAVADLARRALDPRELRAKILAWRALLAPEVATDRAGPAPTTWEGEVDALLASLPRLHERGLALARGESGGALALDPGRRNGFEDSGPLDAWRSVQARSNPRSRVAAGLSLANALAGRADLRLDFELRDESRDANGAFLQWARLEVPFAGGRADLSRAERIELVVRADPARTVRVEIDSPGYPSDDPALRYGWDVEATPTPRVVSLRLRDLALPAWSQAVPPPRAAVLASATALAFGPQPRGRLLSGFFPSGRSDAGTLQVDEIAFVPRRERAAHAD